ncbi:MAG: GAF domain-containing protein, partial [Alphaproteobacteria bacterium]
MSATPAGTFADPKDHLIADLQRQLAERTAERDEALAQQAATAEVLQVINASPGNLAPVFDSMLERATRLCGARFGHLSIYDGEVFRFVAVHGDEQFALTLRGEPLLPSDGVTWLRILDGEDVVHIPDAREDDLYRSGHRRMREFVDNGGGRSLLSVALRKPDALLGVLTVYRQEAQPFTVKQIALLQNFAAQAVIAMENARLLTETREALEQQTATAEVLQVINASPGDLAPVFDAILEKAHSLCGADTGSLQIHEGEISRAVATRGLPEQQIERLRQGVRPLIHHPMSRPPDGADFVQIPDISEVDDPLFRIAFRVGGVRTYLSVPLRKDDWLLGRIVAGRRQDRPFTDKQIALLQNFAAQAVIAMENARLLTETREALEQQTATAEVLQVINSSPGDLAPVFDAMLEKATRLSEAAFGILWVFEEEFVRAGALHKVPDAYADLVRAPFRPSPESGPARVMRGEGTIGIPDVMALPGYAAGDFLVRSIVDLGGARSIVIVPLRKDGVTLGAITTYRTEVRPFSDKQIALLESFAAQAVIA